MLAKRCDLPFQLDEAPFQHRRRSVLLVLENGANIAEVEPRVAIRADQLQPLHLALGVLAVLRRGAQRRLQQPDGLVVQNGGPADAAPPGELGDRKHRRTPTLNPTALDRSTEISNYGGWPASDAVKTLGAPRH